MRFFAVVYPGVLAAETNRQCRRSDRHVLLNELRSGARCVALELALICIMPDRVVAKLSRELARCQRIAGSKLGYQIPSAHTLYAPDRGEEHVIEEEGTA